MKHYMLLSLLLALWCVPGAPVAHGGMKEGSCEDALAMAAAGLALSEINLDRTEGFVFALHHLSNVHTAQHGENGMVFYLTLDVVETICSVHSKKDWKACEIRDTTSTPVYGQCKAAIYISKVHRVVRLYKYNCIVRPVPAFRVHATCPDCPSLIGKDDPKIQETVSLSLEKFNREGGLSNRFTLLQVSRASAGWFNWWYYNVEYTIQETTCLSTAGAADPCPLLGCGFSHKGFCKGSLFSTPSGSTDTSVDCEIYEPECAEREKKGRVRSLPATGQMVILRCRMSRLRTDLRVTLSLKEDPQIPGQVEPSILPFPKVVSANCSPAAAGETLVGKVFSEDPMFKKWWAIWTC
ncbi:fetuin-B-like [Clinocottus analis]|uniref:fetuin-B-like n=1 Tax=Clinocottus analis TaxID=304258 RepID=UPI0035C1F0FF